MKHAYEILFSFRYPGDLTVGKILREMQPLTHQLERLSPNLHEWLLAGDTKDEALLYEVFKDGEPTTAAIAVLDTRLKGKVDPRIITMWNGKDGHEGASLRFMGRPSQHPSQVTFNGKPKSFSPDWRLVADVLTTGGANQSTQVKTFQQFF